MSQHVKTKASILTGSVLLGFAIVTIIAMVAVDATLFPDNHGYTRNVIYVRPEQGSSDPGYFVIVDEFEPSDTIDLAFHSYGTLTTSNLANTTSTATFNQSGTFMHAAFAGVPVTMTNKTGMVYQTDPGNPANDEVPYILVRPRAGARRLVTILTFGNGTLPGPAVSVNVTSTFLSITVNGTDSFVFPLATSGPGAITDGTVSVDGHFCGYRLHANGSLDWLFFENATSVEWNGNAIHASTCTTSGFFKVGDLGGTNSTLLATNGQGDPAPVVPSTTYDPALLAVKQHPYLLFDEESLVDLKAKCNGTVPGPWAGWYASIGGDVLGSAFRGRIDENPLAIQQATGKMLGIDDLDFDWEHDQFISRSTTLYPYLLAYDMIYNNVSIENRTVIEQKFLPKILALADAMQSNSVPTNNHIVVSSAALGIAGLLFNNATWVQLTQDANDFYLANRVRPNGPCFEGDIYGRYAYRHAIDFFVALARVGGYDYFSNPRFLKYLNYTVTSVTPLGWTPVFEDCAAKENLGNVASIVAYLVNGTDPALASNLWWYFEYCSALNPTYHEVLRVTSYEREITPVVPDVGINGGFAYFDSGLAVFRSGWTPRDTYLVISNKHYQQSHVHLDENSIEVYALGKKFLTNPGYPHWRKAGHDYTIQTEASNTALINGKGQLDVTSDGFSACIQNEWLDYIESPSLRAYKSPYRVSSSLFSAVIAIAACASLAIAGTLHVVHGLGYLKPTQEQARRSSQP